MQRCDGCGDDPIFYADVPGGTLVLCETCRDTAASILS